MLQVTHVTGCISRLGGGIPPVIEALCGYADAGDVATRVVALKDACATEDAKRFPAGTVTTCRVRGYKPLGYSPGMIDAIVEADSKPDIIHSHGLWCYPGYAARRGAARLGVPRVLSPHGMLEPWALDRSRRKKRLIRWLFENANLQTAECLHATSAMEAEHFREFGLRNPIAVLPLGLDASRYEIKRPTTLEVPNGDALLEGKVLLFLSRLHPVKGLLHLAEAWGELESKFPDWCLAIAGPDEKGHEAEVRAAVERAGIEERVHFIGPVYGAEKAKLFAAGDVFVLPTYSENFGIVVAEALASACPVITTTATPWTDLPDRGCGWSIDVGVQPLVEAMREAMSLSDDRRREMGLLGRKWVERDFRWPDISATMGRVYQWLTVDAPRPPCVNVP